MKKFFKKFSKRTLFEVRNELSRAHLIIVLLSVVSIILLTLVARLATDINPTLTLICCGLLGFLAIISLVTSFMLTTGKK